MTKYNILSENYLIGEELYNALLTGRLPEKKVGIEDTNKLFIYLVFIRILNKQDKILVYNYVKYDYLFITPILFFIKNRKLFNSLYFNEWGRYLVLLGNTEDTQTENKFILTHEQDVEELNNPSIFTKDWDPFTYINSLTYFTNMSHISHIIDLAYKQMFKEFLF